MTYGLLPSGPHIPSQPEIKAALLSALQTALDTQLTPRDDSVIGTLLNVFADSQAQLWETAQALAFAGTAQASGTLLDLAAEMIGVTRKIARQSECTVELSGTPNTVIPTNRTFTDTTNGSKWITTDSAILSDPDGKALVLARSVLFGEVPCEQTDTLAITSPVFGWVSIAFVTDVALGRLTETDNQLRTRITEKRFAIGSGTLEAVIARVRDLGVIAVAATENDTPFYDSSGRPPHSLEVYVIPGSVTAALIAKTIWLHKPAGIKAYGSQLVQVTDSLGVQRNVRYSLAIEVDIYVIVSGTYDSDLYPGNQAITEKVQLYFNELEIGEKVRYLDITHLVLDIVGIDDLTIEIGLTLGSETVQNIPIAFTSRGRLANLALAMSPTP